MPDQQQPSSSVLQIAGAVGGVAALVVGALYALGALVQVGELHHAGLSVRATFPLIPVEQNLTRGISEVVQPIALLYVLLACLAIAGNRFDRQRWEIRKNMEDATATINRALSDLKDLEKDPRMQDAETELKEKLGEQKAEFEDLKTRAETQIMRLTKEDEQLANRFKKWLLPPTVVAIVIGAALGPWTFIVVTAVGLSLYLWTITRIPRPRYASAVSMVLVVLGLSGGALLDSVVYPQPLPRVAIATKVGGVVSGGLITSNGTTWYVGQGHERFLAVPTSQIRQVTIRGGTRQSARGLLEAILGKDLWGR